MALDLVEHKLHRLSPNQLRSLLELAQSEKGIVDSVASGRKLGVLGKSLGGLFSSLSRQRINEKPLVMAWGKSASGNGLRWKLNTELIEANKLAIIIKEILGDDSGY